MNFPADCKWLKETDFKTISEWWFKTYAEKQLRERSLERLHQFTQRTYAAIGALQIAQIKALHIQLFIDSLERFLKVKRA